MNRNGKNTGVVDGAIVEKESASFLGEYQGIKEGDEPDSMESLEATRKRTRSVAEPASSNTTRNFNPYEELEKRNAAKKREAYRIKSAKAEAERQTKDLAKRRKRCIRRVDAQMLRGGHTNTHAVSPSFNAGKEISASAHRLGAVARLGQVNMQDLTMKAIDREGILQDELLAIYKAEQKRNDEAHALRVREMDFVEGRSAQLHDREGGTGARTNSFSAAPSTALALPAVSPPRKDTAVGQYQVTPPLPQLPARNADDEDNDDWSTHLNSPILENLPAGSYDDVFADGDFTPLPLVPTPALETENDVQGRHENRPGSAEHQGLVADQASTPPHGGVCSLSVYTDHGFELLVEPILSPTASEREELSLPSPTAPIAATAFDHDSPDDDSWQSKHPFLNEELGVTPPCSPRSIESLPSPTAPTVATAFTFANDDPDHGSWQSCHPLMSEELGSFTPKNHECFFR